MSSHVEPSRRGRTTSCQTELPTESGELGLKEGVGLMNVWSGRTTHTPQPPQREPGRGNHTELGVSAPRCHSHSASFYVDDPDPPSLTAFASAFRYLQTLTCLQVTGCPQTAREAKVSSGLSAPGSRLLLVEATEPRLTATSRECGQGWCWEAGARAQEARG